MLESFCNAAGLTCSHDLRDLIEQLKGLLNAILIWLLPARQKLLDRLWAVAECVKRCVRDQRHQIAIVAPLDIPHWHINPPQHLYAFKI